MTRMLVTRPEPDTHSTVARLRALDIDAVAMPVMVRQTLQASLPPPEGFAGMVLFVTALVLILSIDSALQWTIRRREAKNAPLRTREAA